MIDLKVCELLKVYSPLLTQTQSQIAALYYDYDLSLSEIAQQYSVSRQSVSDTVNKVKNALNSFEERLKFYEKSQKIRKILNDSPYFAEIEQILGE